MSRIWQDVGIADVLKGLGLNPGVGSPAKPIEFLGLSAVLSSGLNSYIYCHLVWVPEINGLAGDDKVRNFKVCLPSHESFVSLILYSVCAVCCLLSHSVSIHE